MIQLTKASDIHCSILWLTCKMSIYPLKKKDGLMRMHFMDINQLIDETIGWLLTDVLTI